jgi:acyl-CoA thioesterase FadM
MSIGSVTLECRIVDGPTGVPIAEATGEAVLYDYTTARPVPIPDHIRAAVEALEGKTFPL